MRDAGGDRIVLAPLAHPGRITLRCETDSGGAVGAVLTAKKARKLAGKLQRAADELEETHAPATAGISLRVLSDRVDALGCQNRELEYEQQSLEKCLEELRAEQTWDREQIRALLAKAFGIVAGPNADEPETQADGIRAQAATEVAERSFPGGGETVTVSDLAGRTADVPTAQGSTNATPISGETHYLIPGSWLNTRVVGG